MPTTTAPPTASNFERDAAQFVESFRRLHQEISTVIVGHQRLIEDVLTGLFAGGHVLLEGVPGIGKTMLVSTLADALDSAFSRIQFTPDLMPSDIIGTRVVAEDDAGRKHFAFQKGPVFTQVLLADEINRATPKTQSALLEAMQEKAVTVAGQRHALEPPFFVLATQNPLEMEGTYPLPEAQLDRFLFKVMVEFPPLADLMEVARRTTRRLTPHASVVLKAQDVVRLMGVVRDVPIGDHVEKYSARLLLATHPLGNNGQTPPMVKQFVKYGASPRGLQAMILGGKVRALLDGRFNVSVEDIKQVAPPALRHRIILNFEGEAEEVRPDAIIGEVLEKVAVEAE
jgi:MoxR-like ATPase